jgi:cation diffusion facilitator CzcD-associated flavoprotein CzcO
MNAEHHRIVIIGAGFSGLGMAIRLQQRGITDFLVLERASRVGGTWRDNTYPGCACDIPSHLYSYSFALNPDWSESYARQPEILEYIEGLVGQYMLEPRIRLHHEVTRAAWNETDARWEIQTSAGDFTAHYLISGHGPLAEPKFPNIAGLETFTGTVFHSARWDHGFDPTGKRVAVIGTGASAVQFVPEIAPATAQLYVFQRTPPWVVPRMNRAIPPEERERFKRQPWRQRLERAMQYALREINVLGFSNATFERLAMSVSKKHLEAQISDPDLREKLTPNYRMGCKRITVSDDFYPALARDNVELVTDAVQALEPNGVRTADGRLREVDAIILGTGYHTAESPAFKLFHGRDGIRLFDAWRGSPEAYLGMSVAGFPNLFLMVGPNTGLGHNSIIYMIEAQISYILGALEYAQFHGIRVLEVCRDAQERFNTELQARLKPMVWTQGGCTSFYQDARGRNIGLWPGFTFPYRWRTRRFDPAPYRAAP